MQTIKSRELLIELESHGALAVISLTGFLAQLEVYKLKNLADTALTSGNYLIIMDLSHVTFIDSAGIGTLIQLRAECAKAHGQLVLVAPQTPQINDILRMAGLHQMMDVFSDIDAARVELSRRYGLPDADSKGAAVARIEQLEQQLLAHDEVLRQIEARQGRIEELLEALNKKI